MSDEETPVTVDMVRPYLTDRGRIEVDYAVACLRVRILTADVIELRERLNGDAG